MSDEVLTAPNAETLSAATPNTSGAEGSGTPRFLTGLALRVVTLAGCVRVGLVARVAFGARVGFAGLAGLAVRVVRAAREVVFAAERLLARREVGSVVGTSARVLGTAGIAAGSAMTATSATGTGRSKTATDEDGEANIASKESAGLGGATGAGAIGALLRVTGAIGAGLAVRAAALRIGWPARRFPGVELTVEEAPELARRALMRSARWLPIRELL